MDIYLLERGFDLDYGDCITSYFSTAEKALEKLEEKVLPYSSVGNWWNSFEAGYLEIRVIRIELDTQRRTVLLNSVLKGSTPLETLVAEGYLG
jgi:hypothetical protein